MGRVAGITQPRTQKEKIMTTKTNQTGQGKKPGYIAKARKEEVGSTSYERIGVAWKNPDGSFFVKLAGTQIVSSFMLYEATPAETQTE
jgi:hypothetical protein